MSHTDGAAGNGHDEHVPAAPAKGKTKQGKKPVDSGEASKLVAARISQLEQEHAGEKDQEAEIGAYHGGWPVRATAHERKEGQCAGELGRKLG
jgi:hypothetical protein